MSTLMDPIRAAFPDPVVEVRRPSARPDWEQAAALLLDFVEWMRAACAFEPFVEQPAFAVEVSGLEQHYGAPGTALFVAHVGELAVGTVAVRCGSDGRAELKRMYVRPIARGSGVADRLIASAVDVAAEHGCHTIWLETLRGSMDRAIAVYRRHGFVERDDAQRTLSMDGIVVMERPLP